LAQPASGHIHREPPGAAPAAMFEPLNADRQRHALLRAEQVDRDGISRLAAAAEGRLCEEQRRPAAGRFHATVGDFSDFLIDRHGTGDAREIARFVDRADELPKIIECHGGRRRCRRSGARIPRAKTPPPPCAATAPRVPETRAPTLAGRYRRLYVSTRAGRWRGESGENRRGRSRAAAPTGASRIPGSRIAPPV